MPKLSKKTLQRRVNAEKLNAFLRSQNKNNPTLLPTSPDISRIEQYMDERKHLEDVTNKIETTQTMKETQNDELNLNYADFDELPRNEPSEGESSDELQISNNGTTQMKEKVIERRIIDVSYFLTQLKSISNHGPLGCSINELVLIAETQKGLQSKFTFKCILCNRKFIINSDNCSENYLPINNCVVAGTIAIGGGHSQLVELLSAVNLPVLSENTYSECHDLISRKWEDVSVESMKQAAEKERMFAIEQKKVNKDGIPIIEVIADGCWSKRSYKKNYNALSGAAAIIGRHSGEVLFLGVKNKYCCICALAENKKVDPAQHKCFKNFDGPSTSMESEIIVEGFKQSIKMHNLIYGKLISDGDSSSYSKILQARPYPDVTVEKIECRNHVLRNFCNKLQALVTDTKYELKFRKLITKKCILKIRAAICKSIKKNKTNSDVQSLFQAIMRSHFHGFGDHTKCEEYFCQEIGTNNLEKDLIMSSIWQKICFIVQNVARHARSLIYDVDSNVVERYNSIVAKFVGGKRINFSKKNSYTTRCQAAVVSFNDKKTISRLYKSINKTSPRGKIKRLERRRLMKNERRKLVQKPQNRKYCKQVAKEDINYGENCYKPDMPEEIMKSLKEQFLENLKKTEEERLNIERETILQAQCSEWLELRRSLLTASNFGKVIIRRKDTSCHNFVRDLLYKTNLEKVSSIKHGKENEQIAIEQLEKQENIKIEPCGLFIDEHLPFLGASPDGVVGSDTIVEIKCPITAFKLGLDEAIKKRKVNFWKSNKKGLEINQNHQWYYQIQGQLHITKRSKCLFAIWSNDRAQLKTEIIMKDDSFWLEKMEAKLCAFYKDCILPELIDPRYPRGMPIRNPTEIEDAMRKKAEKCKLNVKPVELENEVVIEEVIEDSAQIDENFMFDIDMPTCSRYLNFKEM